MVSGYLARAFDVLNVGDLDVIAQATAQCDELVVGVFSDRYVERIAGRPPVVPLAERAMLISHIRGVDRVVVHDETAPAVAAPGAVVFTVAGDPVPATPDVLVLQPRRLTTSALVLQAIRTVDSEAVA